MVELYYTAPKDYIFEEVKMCAIAIWDTYEKSYAKEKINFIDILDNIGDNFMFIVSMFDDSNQQILAEMLSKEAKEAISIRIEDGGTSDEYNYFKN